MVGATTGKRFFELMQLARELAEQPSVDALCEAAVREGTQRLGFDRLGLWICEDDPNWVRGSYGIDEHGNVRDERSIRIEARADQFDFPFAGSSDPVVFEAEKDLCNHAGEVVGHGEHASVLMWNGSRIVGVLCSDNLLSGNPFTESDRIILLIYSMTLANLLSKRRAEEALEEASTLYETIFETAGIGIAQVGPTGEWVRVNQRFCEMLGYTREEFDQGTWRSITHPEDIEPNLTYFKEAWEGKRDSYTIEKRYLRKDGSVMWGLLSARTAKGPDGATKYMVSALLDITDRVEAEQQVRQMNTLLEQRVAARTEELKQALEHMEAFSYSVSHDLRAPLRAIHGFSSLLAEDYRDKLDDEGQDMLDRVGRASANMGNLIDALLQLGRVSRAPFQPQVVDLSEEFQHLADDGTFPGFAGTIEVQGGVTGLGDPLLLRAVLQNLIENATKFTALRGAEGKVEFGATESLGGKVYFVRDNGAGFQPEFSSKLFKPFSRLHENREFPGTGIGLATVARIIERHGGRVWAESKPGSGATFYFTLSQIAP